MEKIFNILGIGIDATDVEIKQAYYTKIKEFPPDRNPNKFMEISRAYGQLKDPVKRAKLKLDTPQPCSKIIDVLGEEKTEIMYVGAKDWLKILESK